MTAPATVWILNLDAEIELGRLQAWLAEGRAAEALGYVTPKPLKELSQAYALQFATSLPKNATVLTDSAALPPEARGSLGLSWCPTPSALARLRASGAKPASAPAPEVLLRVNHRRFCAELGQTLPSAHFVDTLSEMNRLLTRESPSGEWLCKRPLGFAGRGQRRISSSGGAGAAARPDNQRWLNESLPHGGLQIEPCVTIVSEFSLHGLVQRNKEFTLGQLCQQQVDGYRAFRSAALAPSTALDPSQSEHLHSEAARVATALATAGYWGPFSVDSYLWRNSAGDLQLNPRSEINARMTMAYPIGTGDSWLNALVAVLGD